MLLRVFLKMYLNKISLLKSQIYSRQVLIIRVIVVIMRLFMEQLSCCEN